MTPNNAVRSWPDDRWGRFVNTWDRIGEILEASCRCVDCGGPLVPCDCRPDCPGGMCARRCDR